MILKHISRANTNQLTHEYSELKDMTIAEISKQFISSKNDFFIILKDKKPFYIITATDIIDVLVAHDDNINVATYVDKYPKDIISFNENESIFKVYKTIRTYKIHHIVTVDKQGKFLSVVTSNDLASFLTELAIKDEMTGLYNKRFFEFIKDRYDMDTIEIGILFIDLDKFKNINDIYGHDIGDIVIKKSAEVIKKNIRDIDYAFRFGGDEFVVMLFTDKQTTKTISQRLDKDINGVCISQIKLKASVGDAHYPTDGNTLESVIKIADENMYKSKRAKQEIKI